MASATIAAIAADTCDEIERKQYIGLDFNYKIQSIPVGKDCEIHLIEQIKGSTIRVYNLTISNNLLKDLKLRLINKAKRKISFYRATAIIPKRDGNNPKGYNPKANLILDKINGKTVDMSNLNVSGRHGFEEVEDLTDEIEKEALEEKKNSHRETYEEEKDDSTEETKKDDQKEDKAEENEDVVAYRKYLNESSDFCEAFDSCRMNENSKNGKRKFFIRTKGYSISENDYGKNINQVERLFVNNGIIRVSKSLYLLQLLLQEKFHLMGSIVGLDYQYVKNIINSFNVESTYDIDLKVFKNSENTTIRIGSHYFTNADELKAAAEFEKPFVSILHGKKKTKVNNEVNNRNAA